MLSEVRNLRAFPAFMSGLHDTIFSGKRNHDYAFTFEFAAPRLLPK
jgi:hypothetical protein